MTFKVWDRQVTVLSSEDIRALRSATDIIFHHAHGQSFIHAWYRAYDNRISVNDHQLRAWLYPRSGDYPEERYREICCSHAIGGYIDGKYFDITESPNVRAITAINDARHDALWHTVAGACLIGSTLSLYWRMDHGNRYTRQAHLAVDELMCGVVERHLRFHIATVVTPADNPNRMIRRIDNDTE